MHARGLFIRGSGAVVLSLLAFYGCGGLNEANVYLDGAVLKTDAGSNGKCGDGKIDGTEDCDGKQLGGQTCKSATLNPASTGDLGCTATCKLDLTHCTRTGGTGGTGGTGAGGGANIGTGGIAGTAGRPGVGVGGRTGGQGGATGSAGGAENVQCTSNSTCGTNRVCCGTETNGQLTGFQCARTCTQNELPTACAKASDCTRGQVCCGTLTATQNQYTGISCAATCTGRNDITLCTTNQECAQGTRCQASQLLPSAFKVCR